MKLNLFINENEHDRYIDIHAPEMDDSIEHIISTVKNCDKSQIIKGYVEKDIHFINIDDIITFKTVNKHIVALTKSQQFNIKYRLYELEDMLPSFFIRISKSEIVNKYYIEKLSLEPNGLIRMYLKHSSYTYSSRRYLKSIKESLAL
ncbi:LytTR family transcriptional regulator DNA-binding domain-containing protein [Staphylococcus simiae]|uniref:LytTR family DNA-binding domain-containing protein n=1 Tax=Staphylococcus simiae TaxID=308354 RepID=UPI001A967515|nr:LytTR family DNA-binding domain-containing protein [Staphylococcus simiae]MBO1198676.1 LytTR family transcriptional regulator DNA-binding domain-containing protein [Staphylococcus simiae]MBO1200839.1 LytTR family transcriptional regulator DNA-binding domain-containing protein [Staphylococcus simiae]MBO1203047.1 LytTR family transcriptional regulator DNA-binding domain-containing protein [Staphylococcus simiae]MBO1211302.1 LytTR family transcriptional regulator DNA-binding domain-containing p